MSDHDHSHVSDEPAAHGSIQHQHQHRRGALLGAVREVFRPHSHDAADSIDSALASDERGIAAVRRSFIALMLTAVAQLAVVLITGSVALLADTIHNFSDALTAVPLFIAFRLGRRPPNRRYTYGYRRAEDLAGLFVLVMIAASAVVAGFEAINRLMHPRQVDHVGILVAAGFVGFVGNELVALYRMREGRAIGSAALVADGYHARTDGFTSLAVVLGGIGVWAGYDWADPVVGLGISVAIFVVLAAAARHVYYRLMDAVDPAIVERITHQAALVPGVRSVASAKARWLGHRLVVDLTIEVDDNVNVEHAHVVATDTRRSLLDHVAHVDEVNVHVHPRRTT